MTIAAVGDTNGYNILPAGRGDGDPLQEFRALLREEDVLILNFEGVLLSTAPPSGTCHKLPWQSLFFSRPRIADFLRPTRLTIATLANNHIRDCGGLGLRETARELSSRGILTVGAGENSAEACRPLQVEVDGVGLALVAYLAMRQEFALARSDRAGAASWEECGGDRQVAELAATTDIVVVALHFHLGRAWTEHPWPGEVALAERALAAGADLVVGHGSHVPQGVLVSHGGIALLSLGNFVFRPDYRMPGRAHRSLLARATVAPDRITLTLVPLRLDESGRPRVPPADGAASFLREIAALSAALGTTVELHGDRAQVTVPRRRGHPGEHLRP